MDFDSFWGLVEGSAVQASDQYERCEWLAARLAALPPGEIADFAVLLEKSRARVDTWAHWQAATLICSGLCGMDSFFYFQAWVVGLGRERFEAVVASPDALADVPHVRYLASLGGVENVADADWPDWEPLYRVPDVAFGAEIDDLLEQRGQSRAFDVSPGGEEVEMEDPADIARRLPRLWALFGKGA